MDTFCEHLKAANTIKPAEKKIVSAFETWRLQFCEATLTTLPPELRRMIYGHMLEDEYTFYIDRGDRAPEHGEWEGALEMIYEHDLYGKSFLQELSLELSSRSTFRLYSHPMEDLEPFLAGEIWDLSVPAYQQIRSIAISIPEPVASSTSNAEMVRVLNHLKRLTRKTSLHVRLMLYSSYFDEWKDYIESLAELVFYLKSKGATVTVLAGPYSLLFPDFKTLSRSKLFDLPEEACVGIMKQAMTWEDLEPPITS
ncbi:hypothetical protein P280DRAFT_482071 [Massarina eburnea CBS 473.64]|uniref:Uncharacterized protein n=1 Tax=Massarina eburnea CBS 473.64 TaxID=1395130 RepID=A0A6A6RTP6_9PLEO|nr:hypothetical protein P280DRAFT_482071 [Massarina eburnea CBS 473.64]